MKDIVKVQEEMKGNFHVQADAIMPLRKFYYDMEALKKSRSVKCQYLKCNYNYNIFKYLNILNILNIYLKIFYTYFQYAVTLLSYNNLIIP